MSTISELNFPKKFLVTFILKAPEEATLEQAKDLMKSNLLFATDLEVTEMSNVQELHDKS